MLIRINKVTDQGAWYAPHVGKLLLVERVEINRHPAQGIPEDVYWCREGGTYNPINCVRKSDATEERVWCAACGKHGDHGSATCPTITH